MPFVIALLWVKAMLAPSIILLHQLHIKVSMKTEQQEVLNHAAFRGREPNSIKLLLRFDKHK